jgi:hypothetical protein
MKHQAVHDPMDRIGAVLKLVPQSDLCQSIVDQSYDRISDRLSSDFDLKSPGHRAIDDLGE